MKPFENKEGGDTTLLGALLAAAVLFLILYGQWSRTNMKSREITLRMAKANAELSNLAAIAYLRASLQHKFGQKTLLKVESNQIIGQGNSVIAIKNGKAIFNRFGLASANPKEMAQKLTSGTSPGAGSNMESTKLEILESAKDGHEPIYVVKATSDAKQGAKVFTPVETIARIKVELPVQGIKTFITCGECLSGAGKFTAKLNYKADINKTYNLGQYKVEASTNLCDIHFMRDMKDPIEDHEGTTSVLKTQVSMYCPCSCKWAG